MSDQDKPAALIVDDDERFRTRLCQAFALRGWEALEPPTAPRRELWQSKWRPTLPWWTCAWRANRG